MYYSILAVTRVFVFSVRPQSIFNRPLTFGRTSGDVRECSSSQFATHCKVTGVHKIQFSKLTVAMRGLLPYLSLPYERRLSTIYRLSYQLRSEPETS